MALRKCLVLIIFSISVLSTNCQNHMLKYVNSGENSAGTPAQFSSTTPVDQLSNTRSRFVNAESICVLGMWALYNTTFYGQGAEDTTTVVSVRGTSLEPCTKPHELPASVLREVKSVHYLGNANIGMDGLVIYSQPYLLGATWDHAVLAELPLGINGFPLGSIAITGSKLWLICEDVNAPCTRGVCVNMNNYSNLFLQRNTARDSSIPNGWPRIVRKITAVTLEVCSNYPNPAPIKVRKSSRRSGRKGGENDDVEVAIFVASP